MSLGAVRWLQYSFTVWAVLPCCYIPLCWGGYTTLKYEVTTVAPVTVITNKGVFQQRHLDATYTVCDIGKFVYFRNPSGGCYGDQDLQMARGQVNLIHSKPEWNHYAQAPETIIDLTLVLNGAYAAAAKFGAVTSNTSEIRITTGSGSITSQNQFSRLVLSPNSRAISLHSEGWFCSETTLACTKTADSSTISQSFWYGQGKGLLIYGVGVNPTNQWVSPLSGNESTYFQTQPYDLNNPGTPIGLFLQDFLRVGVPIHRAKRQAAIIGIPVIETLMGEFKTRMTNYFNTMNGYATSFATTANALDAGLVTLARGMINQVREEIARQADFYTLNLRSSHVVKMLHSLLVEIGQLENAALETAIYFQVHTRDQTDQLQQIESSVKVQYPNCTVETKKLIGNEIFYYLVCGDLAEGTAQVDCKQMLCFTMENFIHVEKPGQTRQVKGPTMSPTTCGLYIRGTDEQILAVSSQSRFDEALKVARDLQLPHLYVQQEYCEYPFSPSFGPLVELTNALDQGGLPHFTRVSENRFRLDCNSSHPWYQDVICQQETDMHGLRLFTLRLPDLNVTLINVTFPPGAASQMLKLLTSVGKDLLSIPVTAITALIKAVEAGLDLKTNGLSIGAIVLAGLALASDGLCVKFLYDLNRGTGLIRETTSRGVAQASTDL